MSKDNTIIVLKNRCLSGGYEYRVAIVTAVANLLPIEDETEADSMARQWFTLYWFRQSEVCFNSKQARSRARRKLLRMRKQRKVVEFGIRKLDRGDELFPTADQKSVENWLTANNAFPFQQTSMSNNTRK